MTQFYIKHKEWIYWLIFSIIVLLLIFVQYYGLVHFRYPVPPGDDPINHYKQILSIYNGESSLKIWLQGLYPPGFHQIIVALARLFHSDPFQSMLWFYPSILALTSITVFIFTFLLIGRGEALAALTIYAFTTVTPTQSLMDGNYPNLIAAQIFLPILILIIVFLLNAKVFYKKMILAIAALILIFMIIFTHHIATFYFLSLLIFSTPVLIIYYAITKKWKSTVIYSALILFIAGLSTVIYLYLGTEILSSARNLAGLMLAPTHNFPFFKMVGDFQAEIWPLWDLPGHLGYLVSLFGFAGFALTPWLLKSSTIKTKITYIILAIWILILTTGSQLQFLTNPERMARDLAFPLTITAALMATYIFRRLAKKPVGLIVFGIIIILLSFKFTKNRFYEAFHYEPMVRLSSADMDAIKILNNNPNKRILVRDFDVYLPIFLPTKILKFDQSANFATMNNLNQYDYVYLAKVSTWVPNNIDLSLPKDINDSSLIQIGHFQNETKEIWLYQVSN